MIQFMGVKKMSRYNENKISYKDQERLLNMFCLIIEKLGSRLHVRDFLKDLLNRQERIMIVRRLLIAELLENGFTYNEIKKKLRCGSSTVARVARWLKFGRGGYKKAIRWKQTF